MSPGWLSAGACAVLLCGVAAAYSDLEQGPDLADVWYQDDNEVHAAAPPQEPGGWAPLLERLLAAAHEDQGIQGYRSPWDANQPLPHKRAPTLLDLKTMPGFERFYQTLQGKRAPASPPAKQPRWKTKKGRPSSGYMCYFKLCSFRTTN